MASSSSDEESIADSSPRLVRKLLEDGAGGNDCASVSSGAIGW
jgi:hypothetical protein